MGERIVLIDDDPSYGNIMSTFASARGLSMDHFTDLGQMGSLGRLSDYSVAIVDFDLGSMNGIEIAEYLPVFFNGMPMILISGKDRVSNVMSPWPSCIKEFVHKDRGPDHILDLTIQHLALPAFKERAEDIYSNKV